MLQISQLFIYPIKSLGGIAKETVEITDTGFKYDRRWMLVDEKNIFLSQRSHAKMALLHTAETHHGIIVSHIINESASILIPFKNEFTKKIQVSVWDDICDALEAPEEINNWFSSILQIRCKLVYMPDSTKRLVDNQYAENDEITSFSDGFPILMIGQSSLNNLNQKLTQPLLMNRFRPNIVFTGGHAHIEDEMAGFSINDINFLGVKPCARCVMTTINQQTAESGKEPLKTLSGYRLKNNKIYFGQNVLQQKNGLIHVGNEIKITKQQAPFI